MPLLNNFTSSKKIYRIFGTILLLVGAILLIAKDVGSTRMGMLPGGSQMTKSPKYKEQYKYSKYEIPEYNGKKVKATFVTLARNRDLKDLRASVKSVEDRFNSKFQYDWVFLNDVEFEEEFKRTMQALISGNVKFGVIPKEHWSYPDWIDKDRAKRNRDEMKANKVIYGDSESYRHMCRFESGFFWRHPLMADYDYYWRVEPKTKMYCDVDYDIFRFMHDNNKKYGFTISIHESRATIRTLWDATTEFLALNPGYLHKNNLMNFISDDNGKSYNLCHFWSNFEIASLDLWRSPAYTDYFNYLDSAGGFFYERWGDAPVHTIAASLFIDRNEVHHFGDLGYYHPPCHQCPVDEAIRLANRCDCIPENDFTWRGFSCGKKYYAANELQKPDNWEDYSK